MKILYLLGPTALSGAAISFSIILEGMIARGCEVIVLVSKSNLNKKFIDYLRLKGCTVEVFSAQSFVYPSCSLIGWRHSFIKFPWRLIRKLIQISFSNREVLGLIKKYQPDIVHTNVGVYRQGFYACKKLDIPHIWHIREYQTKDFGWSIMPSIGYYKSLLQSTNVICISKDIYDYFELEGNKFAKVLWNAILPKSEVCYNDRKQPYFLCANRISPEKKVEDVILAFFKAAHKLPNNYKLVIVGEQQDIPYLNKLRRLIGDSSYASRIEIYRHQSNVTSLMQNATALIVASKFEGLGRMTLEATFKGCLVLGRATGGTKEILERTKGGFLFTTVDELAQLMLHIVNVQSIDEYKDKVEYAQRVVIEDTANDNYNNRLYDYYKSLIAERKFIKSNA